MTSTEIKFECWDGETMHKDVQDYSQDELFSAFRVYTLGELARSHKFWKLRQFTGLKDCAGKEIYEGDILNLFDAEVVFEDGAFYSVSKKFGHRMLLRHIFETLGIEIEIIGNIYENPELLQSN